MTLPPKTPPKPKKPKRRRLKGIRAASSAPLRADPQKVRLSEQRRREKNAANWAPTKTVSERIDGTINSKVKLLWDYKFKGKKSSSKGVYFVLLFQSARLVDVLPIHDVYAWDDGRPCIRAKQKLLPLLGNDEYLYVDLNGEFFSAGGRLSFTYPEMREVPRGSAELPALSFFYGSVLREEARNILKKMLDRSRRSAKKSDLPVRHSIAFDRVSSLIAGLSKRSFTELRQMWLNALEKIETKNPYSKEDITKLLQAIEAEWNRRGVMGVTIASEDYFKWPTTDANPSKSSLGEFEAPGQGVLGYLEYHVGKTHGLPTKTRRAVLDRVFNGKLPPVFDKKYIQQWGEPGTTQRLQKMAESIAAFTRNFKRRDDDKLDQAIREWEADLLFLYEQYYIGKFQFAWPSTKIG